MAPATPTATRSAADVLPTPERPTRPVDAEIERLAALLAGGAERPGDLREQIALLALPLADSLALRYRGRGIETDDLVQVARTALVKAVARYRPGAGAGFAAFAAPTITGELKRWFRDQGWSVRPPRRIQELRSSLVAEEERLRHELSRDPADSELAHVLDVTASDVAEARSCSAGYHATSLDVPTPSGASLADLLLVTPCHSATFETRDALRHAVSGLGDRERLVLRLRFVDELTQSEIGERIGVSQMQVSRILRAVLDRLRRQVLADGAQDHSAA